MVFWTLSSAFSLPCVYGGNHRHITIDRDYTFNENNHIESLTIQGNGSHWFPNINLNGNTVSIGYLGIVVTGGTSAYFHGEGLITSSDNIIRLTLLGSGGLSRLSISSVIADDNHQVALEISSNASGPGVLSIEGDRSNTFTGPVRIAGRNSLLVLYKSKGAIAVQSDIIAAQSTQVRFQASDQLRKSSNITLSGNAILQTLSEDNSDISNTFSNLTIEQNGMVNFHHEAGTSDKSKYYIKVDDLSISYAGRLDVTGWLAGRDFILVRKSSQNLADALIKMNFVGYDPNNIHLEDYNADYWQITAAPEPATTGAILSAVGIGLWSRRKKRRLIQNRDLCSDAKRSSQIAI